MLNRKEVLKKLKKVTKKPIFSPENVEILVDENGAVHTNKHTGEVLTDLEYKAVVAECQRRQRAGIVTPMTWELVD